MHLRYPVLWLADEVAIWPKHHPRRPRTDVYLQPVNPVRMQPPICIGHIRCSSAVRVTWLPTSRFHATDSQHRTKPLGDSFRLRSGRQRALSTLVA